MYVEDVVRMTGTVLEKRRKESQNGDSAPTVDGDLLADELDSDPTMVIRLTGPSTSEVAPLDPLECVKWGPV